jgi:PAS domain S-box-containing protein
MAGVDGYLGRVIALVGLDPTAISYSMADMRPEDLASYCSGRLEKVPGGLHTLSLGRIPKPACAALERLLGIEEVRAVGFAWGDLHYGGVSIGLPKDAPPESVEVIESLVHQATIVIRRLRAEHELQERNAEIDVFFSQSLDLLAVAGTDGYFRQLNPQWEETLGFTNAELTTGRFLDFVHPDDIADTEAALARLSEGNPELHFVNRYRTKNGGYRWLEWRAFPRGDVIYAAARDLTDRIETEQALRKSEARYRLFADNAADVIWLLDVETMRFTYVSPSVERLRGYTVQEVLSQSLDEVMTPGSLAAVSASLPRLIAAFQSGDGAYQTGFDRSHR